MLIETVRICNQAIGKMFGIETCEAMLVMNKETAKEFELTNEEIIILSLGNSNSKEMIKSRKRKSTKKNKKNMRN